MKKFIPWFTPALIIVFYLITHLYQLTLLPVFADEAIYIRWTQLIIDDWQQYLFFPMNDGKTPLLMWLMVPTQFLLSNQLLAARLVAVLIGLGQILSLGYLTKLLGGKKQTTWLVMILCSILPFWFFHHRMALTDGLLGLGMTLTAIGVVQIVNHKQKKLWVGLTALFFGLSLWSKLPAVLLIPSLFIYPWIKQTKINHKVKQIIRIGIATVGGLAIFFSLRLHPVFSQIFSRGSDFLYPWQEVVLQGKWQNTIISIPNYISYFGAYLTWPVLLLNIVGQFIPDLKKRRIQHVLLLSAIIFAGPIALLGKVVYPRYLFPASIFLTISAALMIQELFEKKLLQKILGGILVLCIGLASSRFIYFSLTDVAKTPFVSSDKEQYLYEWSSGYGIKESVDYIKEQSKNKTVAVATEGSFGTLPDGILMYFHRQNVDNIYVEGVGFPVRGVTEKFEEKALSFDQILLVVNSHRLEMKVPAEDLLQEYCRPDNAPCLQIWDITKLLKEKE
ncbi:MAG: phospholipid carrier-dependent glycosyltransferase [Candidatus Pacebacteria bacterium]|nr:phospholipid carrier-dependent glycosyltransferase [Candidatus Paceibacterota bacterium]MBT3512216.1 phospholipid carrier-dependent glycosyltransferase [Candidatus Paceibacterota bacterium]MBT4004554.1 phospholipid carrier-dependent glycosyltransferase [Candidatus Paceibacterota bacterium]MBT4359198.1 phospholipid carrier-dependent glycosyltransferase [Candidatus Paceibacterota bacterium]MBT4681084.1 phospholipid carrier-dependent glycosyltransferase [Candidatus Paceibacterota bacterium]